VEEVIKVSPGELAKFFVWLENNYGPEAVLELCEATEQTIREYLNEFLESGE